MKKFLRTLLTQFLPRRLPRFLGPVLRQGRDRLFQALAIYQYCGRAVPLVWQTNRRLTIALGLLTLVAGLLPAWIAYLGKLIVDSVILAAQTSPSGVPATIPAAIPAQTYQWQALQYLLLEAGAVVLLAASKQGLALCQSLLRALLGQRVNELILEKALTLDLMHFEDAEFYDKMTRARREASSRPLALVNRTFGLVQDAIALITYTGLLLKFSGWAVGVLVVAALPAFWAETRFAGHTFRVLQRRAPEWREQTYLETLMAREDFAKEVKLYQLGSLFLERYRGIFQHLYQEDRRLTVQRSVWSYSLGLVSTAAFYGAYVWIVLAAIARTISLGDLTLYLVVFRQGQGSVASLLSAISSLYEDSLYLSNLYEFLEEDIPPPTGSAVQGPDPADGLRFEQVGFTYPGNATPALESVSLQLRPGEKLAIVGENGSGKTTLIKLLTRLYVPSSGRILLDGLDLQEWDVTVLRRRIGVIFQNFVKYHASLGENIGVGDVEYLTDEVRWQRAAEQGTAQGLVELLGYQTRLGKWFKDGRELSGGQWQKVALSRAFMRERADILVLDEPTSAMDPEAEVQVFEHVRSHSANQMVILISHRFSTVRMADQIVVLADGKILEAGTHEALLAINGRYAKLFTLQASGYR
jgi:ABC-type multidrug transport system fused ATPase/permease subunit